VLGCRHRCRRSCCARPARCSPALSTHPAPDSPGARRRRHRHRVHQVRAGIKFASVTDYVPDYEGGETTAAADAEMVALQESAPIAVSKGLSRFRKLGKGVIAAARFSAKKGTGINSVLTSDIGVGFNVAPARDAARVQRAPTPTEPAAAAAT